MLMGVSSGEPASGGSGDSWFTWWLNQPGPSIFNQKGHLCSWAFQRGNPLVEGSRTQEKSRWLCAKRGIWTPQMVVFPCVFLSLAQADVNENRHQLAVYKRGNPLIRRFLVVL